jgi:adenosylmethionine-8-amino-7-oxononanoate aminotransferase
MQTAQPPLAVTKTDGVRITLDDGRVLIDGIASWWTACHGYNHPHIASAMHDQMDEMPHVMFGGLAHEGAYRLATRLADITPGDLDHVFFSDGGSVAVEVAMKMAIQYFINRQETGRSRFVSFKNAYHGDTFAAMSVCDPDEGMHHLFKDQGPQNLIVPLPDSDENTQAFHQMMDDHGPGIAGVMIEPLVQGAGGMKIHDAKVLDEIRRACDRTGALMIADEIFTGFGRTGAMFACEGAGVVPDIMCLGKALTGGTIGLSATVARTRVFDAFMMDNPDAALMHGPSYMANPLACAAANASLDLFEREPRLQQVAAIEKQMKEDLAPCVDLAGVVALRVQGAIAAVELEAIDDMDWLKQQFVDAGVWLRPMGNIVYLTPPFVIEPLDLRTLTSAVVDVLTRWSKRAAKK